MKKKITAILLTIALLAGCEAAPATAQETTLDIDAIVQQSVAEAIAQYEESQREKDAEIEGLKAQLEELTSQDEETPDVADPPETAPTEESPAAASSQPEEPESTPPAKTPTPTQPIKTAAINVGTVFEGYEVKVTDQTTTAVTSGGKDWPISTWYFWGPGETVLGSISGTAFQAIVNKYHPTMNYDPEVDWSVWFADAFNEYRGLEGNSTGTEQWEDGTAYPSTSGGGHLRLEDAQTVVRLINKEREDHGLDALPIDDDLMELAAVRAQELWDLYDHTRPDGTRLSEQRCGENIGRRDSAQEQVASWMNSEGHRKNNLSERYHHIGAGCYQAANGNLYWVAVFSLD